MSATNVAVPPAPYAPDTARRDRRRRLLRRVAAGAGVVGAAALANHLVARRSEARHPPDGAFLDVDGVRLHYREAGAGPAIVLLHGNGVDSRDFLVSGLMGRLARTARVIAFDRPGFGYSKRPRSTLWTPAAQARLLLQALHRLDAAPAFIVGHSWGALVAAEMVLAAPERTAGLVLMSGYYRPTPRLDAVLLGGPSAPVAGDLLRYTISPAVGAVIAPVIVRQLFAPAPVTERFRRGYPISMSLRPSQLHASAAEAELLIPSTVKLARRLSQLGTPTLIIAGAGDRLISTAHQSSWLAGQLPRATYVELEDAGHMIHHSRPDEVSAAIEGFITDRAVEAALA